MDLAVIIWIFVLLVVIVVGLVYAFVGPLSLPFYLLGVFSKIVYFPIILINQVIYPVGPLPYIVWSWFIVYILIKLIFKGIRLLSSRKASWGMENFA